MTVSGTIFITPERDQIKSGIRKRYSRVAMAAEGQFRYPTGKAGLKALGYELETPGELPDEVLSSYCGVGRPFAGGSIEKGQSVLDIDCGAGVDTLIAAMMAGEEGRGVGLDLVPEMVERAKRNLAISGMGNASFLVGSGEDLPFRDRTFEVVISNGAFNLIPDKARALSEVFRVLMPQGKFLLADQVLSGELSPDTKSRVESWAG